MAKVKILLEPGESQEEAHDALVKALTAHEQGEIHTDTFLDPVMEEASNHMKDSYRDINREMLAEIEEVLDREGV